MLAGCVLSHTPACPVLSAAGSVVVLIDHGWHTDLGIPVGELSGPIAVFRKIFPGAHALVFGFGKRTFMTARVDRWQEFLIGPFPGPGAMLVAGLAVSPDQAYAAGDTVVLPLPPGGAEALSAFLTRSFAWGNDGWPRFIATGPWRGSLFYDSAETYTLANTCNDWSVRALRAAGVPVSARGVLLAGQAMHRARIAAGCALTAE